MSKYTRTRGSAHGSAQGRLQLSVIVSLMYVVAPWCAVVGEADGAAVDSAQESSSTESPISADRLADLLSNPNDVLRGDFETTFEVCSLGRKPATDNSPWESAKRETSESIRFVTAGKRLYSLRTRLSDSDAPTRYLQENVWADGTWTHRVQGEASVSLLSEATSPDPWGYGFIFNEIDGRCTPWSEIAREVRAGRCIAQSIVDGVLNYRFEAMEALGKGARFEVQAALAPNFRFISYTIEGFVDGDREQPRVRETYTVRSWKEIDGCFIPDTADLQGWSMADPTRQRPVPTKGMKTYHRTDFKRLTPEEIDESLFVTPMPLGTSVWDDRLNMSFKIGTPLLYLEGVLYELKEPLMEHPGDRLSELVRTAVNRRGSLPEVADARLPGALARAAAAEKPSPNEAPLRGAFVVALSTAIALVVAGVFLLRRGRGARATI